MDSVWVMEAVVLWTGWQRTAWPQRDKSRLVARFGVVAAEVLLAEVLRLEADFYGSRAWAVVSDLSAMGDLAADEFRAMHPEVGEDAVQALAWCYTFDYR
jgi:hypothetical protein